VLTGFRRGGLREKRPLGRQGRRWKGTIKMDIQEVGLRGMDWIDLAQDSRDRWWALLNAVTNLRVPPNAGKFWTS
jgi:hypothetical protein